jgi:hypothetical protein
MSRILPAQKTSLDYSLWDSIKHQEEIVDQKTAKYLALYDRGGSAASDFWRKEGRPASENELSKVIDFIGLENRFDTWFEAVRLRGPQIISEIELLLENTPGYSQYYDGCKEDWLTINWGTLGRVIGAATLNIGSIEKWFTGRGTDAKQSLLFWFELQKSTPPISAKDGIRSEDWENIITYFIEKGFDPTGEMRRARAHRPTSPFWERQVNFDVRYYPNPIALLHLKRFQDSFSRIDPNEEDIKEFSDYHGTITMKLLQIALGNLQKGNYAEFAVRLHGLCAIHCMQDFPLQQKIGLHLVTNLGLRKELRGVQMLNVPDLAYEIGTNFTFGKVLQILHKSKLIRWVTVEQQLVVDAVKELK